MVFLALLDISFDMENHMFYYLSHGTSDQRMSMIMEILICIWGTVVQATPLLCMLFCSRMSLFPMGTH